MKYSYFFLLFFILITAVSSFGQEEPVLYYQMEPLDDSLFIQIQEEVFIDPPDPKAEIIVDLRDVNNQTVQIKGTLYPFLAFSPETRAKIQTFPFKINLAETIDFASIFTRVPGRLRLGKIVSPPTLYQISPTLGYVNPFLQIFGGERLGMPLKGDVGFSLGIGTPYSGPFETNFFEANFHILGFRVGAYSRIDAMALAKRSNTHNNIYFTTGLQFGYVIPLGNYLEISYIYPVVEPLEADREIFTRNDTLNFHAKIVESESFGWEFRYPFRFFGSTRAKFYVGQFVKEWHIGLTAREMALAGSIFDLRFDAMFDSDVRQPQYLIEFLIQKVFETWAFSAFAFGPSAIFSKTNENNFGVTTIFLNLRFKIGTSL